MCSLVLSFFVSNKAREALLTRQERFAQVLVENLNHQIFQRFALPTLVAHGRIALRQPAQFDRMDQVVKSVIHGLPVARLRIYDPYTRAVAYATDREGLGKQGLAPAKLDAVLESLSTSTTMVSTIPTWQAPFRIPLEKGTFVLQVLCPLRGESIQPDVTPPVMGVLELTQDITGDYEQVMAIQGIIVLMCLMSSMVLFILLHMLLRRAERILAERMLKNRQLENEIHSNEKLVSMGRVVASIAHEIRNPLGIIQSSAELLKSRPDRNDAASSRILAAVYDEALRLSRTVNDFLDYARPVKPNKIPIDLNMVLDQAFAFMEVETQKQHVTVERDTPPDLVIPGDKDLLYRAFYNILVNGLQAMNGEGKMKVTARRENGNVVLEFLDSGPGFDPKTVNSILDPFFTTKEAGTGLGLPIVQSIVISHGGRMELANGETGGALVRVMLPGEGND
ncbi:MAG: two-component sensor histidine kinase [Desulfovibrio sp.]|nr:two-component sensor histidine kinase [Desulfovibrio sp.]